MSKPTPSQSPFDESSLVKKLGDICHEHYLGCGQNKSAPDGYEYVYDNEVINLLGTPEAKAAIRQAVRELVNGAKPAPKPAEPLENTDDAQFYEEIGFNNGVDAYEAALLLALDHDSGEGGEL